MGKFFSNRVDSDTKDEDVTTSRCTEEFIGNNSFSSRAVVCVEAYQKFAGLYNFLLITTSTDEPLMNLQSRLVINGTSYENGQKFISQFLKGLSKDTNGKEKIGKEKTTAKSQVDATPSNTKEAK